MSASMEHYQPVLAKPAVPVSELMPLHEYLLALVGKAQSVAHHRLERG
jgi:hypothetical protein